MDRVREGEKRIGVGVRRGCLTRGKDASMQEPEVNRPAIRKGCCTRSKADDAWINMPAASMTAGNTASSRGRYAPFPSVYSVCLSCDGGETTRGRMGQIWRPQTTQAYPGTWGCHQQARDRVKTSATVYCCASLTKGKRKKNLSHLHEDAPKEAQRNNRINDTHQSSYVLRCQLHGSSMVGCPHGHLSRPKSCNWNLC
jgi:hypothetical protein